MKFDARAAREIEPGGFLSYAPAYPGLRLQVPQSGTWRAWAYRYRKAGHRQAAAGEARRGGARSFLRREGSAPTNRSGVAISCLARQMAALRCMSVG